MSIDFSSSFFFFFQRWNVEIAWNYWIRSRSFLERNENGSPRNPWLDRWFARSCSLDGERVWLNIVERVGCALAGLKCESVPWIRPWYSCISQSTSNRPSTGWANSYTRSRFQSWPRYLDFFPPNPGRDIRFL